jgi:hypothetical protein
MYNILTESGIPMTLAKIIKLCLNEAAGKFYTVIHLIHLLFRIA